MRKENEREAFSQGDNNFVESPLVAVQAKPLKVCFLSFKDEQNCDTFFKYFFNELDMATADCGAVRLHVPLFFVFAFSFKLCVQLGLKVYVIYYNS